MTEITLRPKLTISDSSIVDRANKVLQLSEKQCLISNSIKSKVVLMPEVSISNTEKVVVVN
jgi:organic hydroperoxide reductase OsmC/OhrA